MSDFTANAWRTPGYFPEGEDTFTPFAFVKPKQNKIKLPNGMEVSQEQLIQFLKQLSN